MKRLQNNYFYENSRDNTKNIQRIQNKTAFESLSCQDILSYTYSLWFVNFLAEKLFKYKITQVQRDFNDKMYSFKENIQRKNIFLQHALGLKRTLSKGD